MVWMSQSMMVDGVQYVLMYARDSTWMMTLHVLRTVFVDDEVE